MNENEKRPFPEGDGILDPFEALVMYKAFREVTDDGSEEDEIYDDRDIEFGRRGVD